MISRIPGVRSITSLFTGRTAYQEATAAMARVISQLELVSMPYTSGLSESRRSNGERQVAIGVWMLELPDDFVDEELLLQNVQPVVTADVRNQGLGLLLPKRIESSRVLIGISDAEELWKFFVMQVVHQSPRPGGWHQLGLKLERLAHPNALQLNLFRSRATPDRVDFDTANSSDN